MNTKKLKNFAQETRRKLLEQVEAKLEHVLEADTGALREKKPLLKELKKDIGKLGREQVIDKVAYTWFNRFVALRYMDARGFEPLNISVLTPEEGQVSPQLLQEAMGGHIPGELGVDTQKVMDILDAKTGSPNPENEAYRLLLIGACNYLHEIFPFLFEPIDDYTELLLPDDLTSEFSVIPDVVEGMKTEDCQQVEVLGWLYQFYISEKKDAVFAAKGKVQKEDIPAVTQLFTPRWIVEYMVQNTIGKLWVQNNPDSSLKEHMDYYIESPSDKAEDYLKIESPEEILFLDPASGSGHILVYAFELLTKIYEEAGYAPSDVSELILSKNLHGIEIDERASQLSGLSLMMKARDYYRRAFRKDLVPDITCLKDLSLSEDEIKNIFIKENIELTDELLHDLINMREATNYGSLIIPDSSQQTLKNALQKLSESYNGNNLFEAEKKEVLKTALKQLLTLGKKYHCVSANPPYMGSSKANKNLKDFIKSNYPNSKKDLMACFMESSLLMLQQNGFLGMINQHSWMFLSSYKDLRKRLIDNIFIDSLLHLGPRTFPEIGGEVVQNSAFTFCKCDSINKGNYIRLVDYKDSKMKKIKALEAVQNPDCNWFCTASQENFEKVPGNPIGYWLSKNFISVFDNYKTIDNYAIPKFGMSTGNGKRFIRYIHEVSNKKIYRDAESLDEFDKLYRWAPLDKGGSFRKWYGNQEHVVDWKNNGETIRSYKKSAVRNPQYFLRKHISWTLVTSTTFSARFFEDGFLLDTASNCVYLKDINIKNRLIGFLNSNVANEQLQLLNPTMNYSCGVISLLPFVDGNLEKIDSLVESSISISKTDWNTSETSIDFLQNELIRLKEEQHVTVNFKESYDLYKQYWQNKFWQLHQNEEELNRQFIEIYGLQDELTHGVPLDEITILQDELNRKKLKKLSKQWKENSREESQKPTLPFKDKEVFSQFISYAVGCMFGRYSLDKEGLILANQGETSEDYLSKVYGKTHPDSAKTRNHPSSRKDRDRHSGTFIPDEDNIIPILDDEWFEDDIVARFHQLLKVSFGDENFQQNLAFVEDHIKYGDIRKYFSKSFYKDHYKRYKKRSIYWKFSSPKGHFSVLIYMHRYTSDTLNNILNNYLRPFIEKLEVRKEHMQQVEQSGSTGEKAKASKEIDKLNAMLKDCKTYEREIIYPLASERIEMDLDDGVLVNYNLFGQAVETIKSVNDKKKKKKVKEFEWIDGSRIR